MTRELGDRMVSDPRFKLLTFTGSPSVGWRMKERAGKKKVVLELGGNAGRHHRRHRGRGLGGQADPRRRLQLRRPVVHQRPADLRPRVVADAFREKLLAGVRLPQGRRPARPDDRPRPDGRRRERRARPALGERGRGDGRRRCSPAARRTAPTSSPTVLADVPTSAEVCSNEAFAPLVVLSTFSDFGAVIEQVNDSAFGLQTGVFTNDLAHAWQAFNELEVGGVVMNDISSYRVDHMPYGGVKDSGLGREGLRWSIEDMTELKIMVVAQPQ